MSSGTVKSKNKVRKALTPGQIKQRTRNAVNGSGDKRPKGLKRVKPMGPGPNAIVEEVGGRGIDPLAQRNQSMQGREDNLVVQTMTTNLSVVATASTATIRAIAAGMVLQAMRHGWLSALKQGEYPYFAWQYTTEAILSAMRGETPIVQNAPIAFWDLLAAVKPKETTFKTGHIKYSWVISPDGGYSWIYPLRLVDNVYSINWGLPDFGSEVNGFPVVNNVGAGPYTEAIGAASFASMCSFLGSTVNAEIRGLEYQSSLETDVSAFSVSYPEIGESTYNSYGLVSTIYNEKKIAIPLLAKIAQYQPSGPYYRGWQTASKSAGSAFYILPRMLECSGSGGYYNKASPVVKYFNFDEYYVVLAEALGGALYNFYSNIGNAGVTTCPLTVQQVQLLLRQAILSIMPNQFDQDIVLGNAFTPMIPFVVAANGVSVNAGSMLLPTALCENIRSSCRRLVQLSKEKGKYTNYVEDVIPILCRPNSLQVPGNYVVTLPDEGSFNVFKDAMGETPISLVDLSTTLAGNPVFVALSGEVFSALLSQWNSWISTLQSCLSPLQSIGAEAGIMALSTVYYTNTQQDVPLPQNMINPNAQAAAQVAAKAREFSAHIKLTPCAPPIKPTRQVTMKKTGGLVIKLRSDYESSPVTPTYLDTWTEKEIFCNQKTVAPIFKYISDMIVPVALSTGEGNQASTQTWQTFMIEPYTVPRTLSGGFGGDFPSLFPTIASRLSRMASYDVTAFTSAGKYNEFIENLVELGKTGRGGFFASLAGSLADGFIPGVGKYVRGFGEGIGL